MEENHSIGDATVPPIDGVGQKKFYKLQKWEVILSILYLVIFLSVSLLTMDAGPMIIFYKGGIFTLIAVLAAIVLVLGFFAGLYAIIVAVGNYKKITAIRLFSLLFLALFLTAVPSYAVSSFMHSPLLQLNNQLRAQDTAEKTLFTTSHNDVNIYKEYFTVPRAITGIYKNPEYGSVVVTIENKVDVEFGKGDDTDLQNDVSKANLIGKLVMVNMDINGGIPDGRDCFADTRTTCFKAPNSQRDHLGTRVVTLDGQPLSSFISPKIRDNSLLF